MAMVASQKMRADDGTLLLVNPNARSGEYDRGKLTEALQVLGPVVTPRGTGRDAATRAIADHAGSVQRVVIGGGDGSLHAALPALLDAGLPLGVLPLGTANDFARSLGISDVANALEVILSGHTKAVDVGLVNDIPFLNAVGIGLGPEINKDLDKESKSSFGVFAYLLHAVRNLRDYQGIHAVIECDGAASAVRSLQITIVNGIHYGGGMTISSDARLDDGLLEVLSIPPQSVFSLLLRGPALRSGNTEDVAGLRTFRGKKISVRTRRPMDVTADGEPVTKTPVECRTIEGSLRVYAPPSTD
jgi:YegS/Rv2252/BmrU family lipid kinase